MALHYIRNRNVKSSIILCFFVFNLCDISLSTTDDIYDKNKQSTTSSKKSAQPHSFFSELSELAHSINKNNDFVSQQNKMPSENPSMNLSSIPSDILTTHTSLSPSMIPSEIMSISPSSMPSDYPSINLSSIPSNIPTSYTSNNPSSNPSVLPSNTPTTQPSFNPTNMNEKRNTNMMHTGNVTFSVMGDQPYTDKEARVLPSVLQSLPSDSDFIVHVGDLWNGRSRCREENFHKVRDILLHSHIPMFIIPGDNDWYDCPSRSRAWNYWVSTFQKFENLWRNNPEKKWPFNTTEINHQEPDYVENFGFLHKGILFIGVHLIGGKTLKDTYEANIQWTKQMLDKYEQDASTIVIFGHAAPTRLHRSYFRPVNDMLHSLSSRTNENNNRDDESNDNNNNGQAQSTTRSIKPAIYICGDGHRYRTFIVNNTNGLKGIMVDNKDALPLQVTINNYGEVSVDHRNGLDTETISTWD